MLLQRLQPDLDVVLVVVELRLRKVMEVVVLVLKELALVREEEELPVEPVELVLLPLEFLGESLEMPSLELVLDEVPPELVEVEHASVLS